MEEVISDTVKYDEMLEHAQSWGTVMEAPGAKVVKAPASAATLGTYLTLMPLKAATRPSELVIENVSAGSFDRGLFGSFKILRVSSPTLVMTVLTLKLSMFSTEAAPKVANEFRYASRSRQRGVALTFDLQGDAGGTGDGERRGEESESGRGEHAEAEGSR